MNSIRSQLVSMSQLGLNVASGLSLSPCLYVSARLQCSIRSQLVSACLHVSARLQCVYFVVSGLVHNINMDVQYTGSITIASPVHSTCGVWWEHYEQELRPG